MKRRGVSNEWSRRRWVFAAAGVSTAAATPIEVTDSPASDSHRTSLDKVELSGFYYRDYFRCLPEYLSALAREAREKRAHELSLLTTPASITARQHWAREIFWKLAGGEPARSQLNARITGRFERERYFVEKVIYESRPGVVVSANLYLPKTGTPPYPAVLFQMGHSALGKAYAPYQKCCQGLAQLGYVVLGFDPMGQGERIAYPDASGTNTRLESVDEEHSVPGKQLLLLGDTATRFQVWDAVRSLDLLAAHKSVDPTRLASVGQSGGATITMLLACVDDRLSAAVVCSGNTENFACSNFDSPGSTDDAEQDLIGSGLAGFDRWDLLYPFAPKPLLVQVSAHDFFGTYSPSYLNDSWEGFEQLARVYKLLGKPDQLSWRSTPLPHGLNYEFRVSIYNWLERWLKRSGSQVIEEPPVKPEEPNQLWTGPTGNVTRDYRSFRPIDLVKEAASQVRRDSADRESWRAMLGLQQGPKELRAKELSVAKTEGAKISAVEVNSAEKMWIPSWLFVPDSPNPREPTLLALDDHGRNAHAHEDDLYHRLARAGKTVCAADLCGIGDCGPEVGRGNPAYTIPHATEEQYAWASLILGRPLLSQRIIDILAVARSLKNNHANTRLVLAAKGRLTVPALFAFAASQDFDSLYLVGGLISYANLLETESYQQTLANFGWDLFRHTDLPQLAAEAAPRRIRIAGAVLADGHLAESNEVRRIYNSTNVDIQETARWDDDSLGSL